MRTYQWLAVGPCLLAIAVLRPSSGSVLAQAPASAGKVTILRCGHVVDTRAAQLKGPANVVIEGNRIKALQKPDAPTPAGATVVDLRKHTCMPGLMDMHVHLSSEYSERSKVERFTLNPGDYAVRAVVNARKTLLAGFTTVRDLGGRAGSVFAVRDVVKKGLIPGPRIFAAGKAIATTGGHADPTNGMRFALMGDPGPDRGVISGADEAREAVRHRYKLGSDQIKITATGGVLSVAKSGQNPQFTVEELRAIIETAADYGMHVAAHAHGVEGMRRAIVAGVHSIEHGTLMDAPTMRLMKKHGTWLVPTVSAGEWVADKAKLPNFFPAAVRPKAASIGPKIRGTFGRAYKAGVKIAFGTDTGVPAHGDNAKEFEYMVAAGMPALEAIRSATYRTAQLLGVVKTLGTLDKGKFADIVAVPGDPAKDIAVMRNMSFVMKNGRVYTSPN